MSVCLNLCVCVNLYVKRQYLPLSVQESLFFWLSAHCCDLKEEVYVCVIGSVKGSDLKPHTLEVPKLISIHLALAGILISLPTDLASCNK